MDHKVKAEGKYCAPPSPLASARGRRFESQGFAPDGKSLDCSANT
jgi:hypothetical protein